MTSGSSLAILSGTKSQQRVEVVLGQRSDGSLTFELHEQHYAEGIGWFDQRTLALEPSQIRQLRQILNTGSTADRVVEEALTAAPTILAFPGPPATPAQPRRPAVGDRC